jgi:hypothetical protein
MAKIRQMDQRLRNVILQMDAKQKSFEDICAIAVMDAAALIAAIGDRAITPGLDGNKKNYMVAQRIAQLRIRMDQLRLVFPTDPVDTFERSMMKNIEENVRAIRSANIPPREFWERCVDCGGLVHPQKSTDSFFIEGERVYRCHKCVD